METLLKDVVPFKGQIRLEKVNPALFRCAEKPLNLDFTGNKYLHINGIPCEGSTCAPQSVIDMLSKTVL